MAGGKALADSIGQVGNAFSSAIAENIGNKEKAVALDASMSIIQQQAPTLLPPDFMEKFHGAGVSAKAGMMTTALAMLNRQDQQATQGKDFTLKTIQASNTAAYQQGSLDNQAADNARQDKKANWEMAPDNQQPVTMDVPGATAYGVTGDKSGTRIFNFIPKPKPPVQPGMVLDPKTGAGYFADAQGRPVNPENLLYDPVAGGPGGPPQDTLLPPLDGPPPAAPTAAPAPPGETSTPLPAGKPFSSRLQPVVPRRTPDAPAGWQLRNSAQGMFAVKGDQVARYNSDAGNWIVVPMPDAATMAPAGAPAAAAPKAAVPFWKR